MQCLAVAHLLVGARISSTSTGTLLKVRRYGSPWLHSSRWMSNRRVVVATDEPDDQVLSIVFFAGPSIKEHTMGTGCEPHGQDPKQYGAHHRCPRHLHYHASLLRPPFQLQLCTASPPVLPPSRPPSPPPPPCCCRRRYRRLHRRRRRRRHHFRNGLPESSCSRKMTRDALANLISAYLLPCLESCTSCRATHPVPAETTDANSPAAVGKPGNRHCFKCEQLCDFCQLEDNGTHSSLGTAATIPTCRTTCSTTLPPSTSPPHPQGLHTGRVHHLLDRHHPSIAAAEARPPPTQPPAAAPPVLYPTPPPPPPIHHPTPVDPRAGRSRQRLPSCRPTATPTSSRDQPGWGRCGRRTRLVRLTPTRLLQA